MTSVTAKIILFQSHTRNHLPKFYHFLVASRNRLRANISPREQSIGGNVDSTLSSGSLLFCMWSRCRAMNVLLRIRVARLWRGKNKALVHYRFTARDGLKHSFGNDLITHLIVVTKFTNREQ